MVKWVQLKVHQVRCILYNFTNFIKFITSMAKLYWTEHSKIKMRQYGLSKTKLINLIYKPERKEIGIAPGTVAVMKSNKSYTKIKLSSFQKRSAGEVWLMYKDVKELRNIISAWRYPGISKPGESIPIPEDIRRDILSNSYE